MPNFSAGYHIVIKSMHLRSIGDLDRNNEEIELEITSNGQMLDCGLFLFDVEKGKKDIDLNINEEKKSVEQKVFQRL